MIIYEIGTPLHLHDKSFTNKHVIFLKDTWYPWPPPIEKVKEVDIIINCSSIGFENFKKDKKGIHSLKFFSPLGNINKNIRVQKSNELLKDYAYKAAKDISKNVLETIRFLSKCQSTMVFDLIYHIFYI